MNNLISRPNSGIKVELRMSKTTDNRRFLRQFPIEDEELDKMPEVLAYYRVGEILVIYARQEADMYSLQHYLMDGFEPPTDFRSELLGDIQ